MYSALNPTQQKREEDKERTKNMNKLMDIFRRYLIWSKPKEERTYGEERREQKRREHEEEGRKKRRVGLKHE